jgi:hypothetical protein
MDLKKLGLAEHIFKSIQCHFMFGFENKHGLAVSNLTVTLQMMSNNHRSFSSIGVVHVRLIIQ